MAGSGLLGAVSGSRPGICWRPRAEDGQPLPSQPGDHLATQLAALVSRRPGKRRDRGPTDPWWIGQGCRGIRSLDENRVPHRTRRDVAPPTCARTRATPPIPRSPARTTQFRSRTQPSGPSSSTEVIPAISQKPPSGTASPRTRRCRWHPACWAGCSTFGGPQCRPEADKVAAHLHAGGLRHPHVPALVQRHRYQDRQREQRNSDRVRSHQVRAPSMRAHAGYAPPTPCPSPPRSS